MKILLASHCFYPSTGGIETVSDLLAREFTERGHEVRVVTQTPGDGSFPYEVIRCPGLSRMWGLVGWCDVFLQNNISLRTIWPALLRKRPLFITHQTWLRPPGQRPSLAENLKRVLARKAMNISISSAIARELDLSSTVIGNPFDDGIFADLGGSRDQDLVFIGRLVSDKGTDVLLTALKQLREGGQVYRLTIIGDGPERGHLLALARNGGIENQINFVGTKRGPELAAILNRHKLLVVPSRWPEPFGIVALEGIASGCVVIGSSQGGLPEAIGPCGVTFPNGDASALAREIRTLMNSDRRRQLLDAAPAHLAKFRRAAVAERYLQLMGTSS